MTEPARFYLTTAIDYPNSLPHVGTAFEKLGADVQARYRRMHGFDVFFLMGNDENTVKVEGAARAYPGRPEFASDTRAYCDFMARQFQDVWKSLEISNDDFIQTSEERHHVGCRKFIQKVFDNGHIYKGTYEGLYCEGCEAFKTEKEIKDAGGICPDHKVPPIRRSEPCYYFALSKFRDRLLAFYEANPDFIQPETRRNEVVTLVQTELLDVNISRLGQKWGIRIPFDEEFTIYVWFDALLNYITGIGYGTDEERFRKWWPADLHFIGKDITRFHCALWPAMCFAAGIDPPKRVFGHGFLTINDVKISKSLGNVVSPDEVIAKFGVEGYRYFFLRECPFPGDGNFSWKRMEEVYNGDLANNLGNLYSRKVKLLSSNHGGRLEGTAGVAPVGIPGIDFAATVGRVKEFVEGCRYSQALQAIWLEILDPANKYVEDTKPWSLAKTDPLGSARVLYELAEVLRVTAILLKPFLPRSAETIYQSFNFPTPWSEVRYEHAATPQPRNEDLRVLVALEGGKVKPLFPRVELNPAAEPAKTGGRKKG
jgi:methionyl-tRNA synthetase